jgi:ribose transport system substrate-binding protein
MALGAEQALAEKGIEGVWILGGAGMKDIVKRVMNKDPMYPGNIACPPSMIATGIEDGGDRARRRQEEGREAASTCRST